MDSNPLTDALPPRYRKTAYAVLFVAATVYALFQAADGDWGTFAGSVLTALVGLLAAGNVTAKTTKASALHRDESGQVSLLLLVALSAGALLIAALGAVTMSTAQAQNAPVDSSTSQPTAYKTITGWAQQPTSAKTITGWKHHRKPTAAKTITGWGHAPQSNPYKHSLKAAVLDPTTVCWHSPSDDARVCVDVYWHGDGDGVGISVEHIYERIGGGFWENKAVDCDNIRLWNSNDVVKWRKDDAECDIYRTAGPGHDARETLFHPHVDMGGTETATVGFTFDANLDAESDVNGAHITVHMNV